MAEKSAALKKKRGESQMPLTDPGSRAMAAYTKVGAGYQAQIAVDANHKMIVEQAGSNDVLATGLRQQAAAPARQLVAVEKIAVVADKGYFRTEDIAAGETAGLMPDVPRPQRGAAVTNGFFRKDEFRSAAAQDVYVCPGGHELKPLRHGWLREMKKIDCANASACSDCPLRERCTNTYRAVSRLENADALERMEQRVAARPDLLGRRREIVAPPFGTIKQGMNPGTFLRRGLEKVRAAFSLTALAYNLRRALNIRGTGRLLAAVTA